MFTEHCHVLGVRDTAGNKTDSNLCPSVTYILVGETENKLYIYTHTCICICPVVLSAVEKSIQKVKCWGMPETR